MILNLHGSMGDCLMMTGIPEAYYKRFGEKTCVPNRRNPAFWENNPFLTNERSGENFTYAPNAPRDYMIYYPVRVFYDLTGHIVQAKEVRPNIYRERKTDGSILVNDMAGWPSRRGYPHFDALIRILSEKYNIIYMRNNHFRDCFGIVSSPEISHFDEFIPDPDDKLMINTMARAVAYIGYDSGLSVLAGAMNVPHVLLSGSVSPINTAHPSCIYALEIPGCRRCADPGCHGCLQLSDNMNEEIIECVSQL